MAIPTGGGKSYIIAEIIRRVTTMWGVKVLVLSHVKEILEQDATSLKKFLPEVSVYSAGLGLRQIGDVTVAGIQSCYRNPEMFKQFQIVIIDEAHRISPREGTMYQKFFDDIGEHVRIGLTATPYRLGKGYIYEGPDRIFDYIAYDLTSKDSFLQLIKDGYLCKLVTKGTRVKLETEGVRTTAGDFNEKDLAAANDKEEITNAAIEELIAAGHDRKKWLVFAIDIAHAEHIAESLMRRGIRTNVVHSKMEMDRDQVLKDYKNGKYQCIVNVNVLTTGFDDPAIDLIGILRPTKSPVLHVQTIGRGLRVHPGKPDCLVLDFAGNTARLGPINDVVLYVAKKGGKAGPPAMKECPKCLEMVYPAVRICPECKHEFVFDSALEAQYTDLDIISEGAKWLPVTDVIYTLHAKISSPSTMKVTYLCGTKTVREWICVEHSGYAKARADHWLQYRGGKAVDTAQEAVDQKEKLARPLEILVDGRGKYPVVKDCKFP